MRSLSRRMIRLSPQRCCLPITPMIRRHLSCTAACFAGSSPSRNVNVTPAATPHVSESTPERVASPSRPTATPEVDAHTAEQIRVAQEIGEEAFDENIKILQKVALRGLRALVVFGIGMCAFLMSKRRLTKKEEKSKEDDEDPTQRYLTEMRSLGFDVDTLEDELVAEKKQHSHTQ